MKKYALILFLLTQCVSHAQELSFYRSYLAVPEVHNPAYNGALACTKLTISDKHQWLGIKDAPSQQVLSANIRMERTRFNRGGLGILFLNDLNGDNNATGLSLAYAEHFMVQKAKGHWLGMAISANGFYHRIDDSDFIANSSFDPLIAEGTPAALRFNASGGLLYYSKIFETGLSFSQILPNTSYIDNSYKSKLLGIYHAQYHYYPSKKIRMMPGVAVRYEYTQHTALDINFKYDLIEKYWWAISMRMYAGDFENTINSFLLYLGYRYKNIELSYSADIGTTRLQGRNFGGHEIAIGMLFCKPDCGCKD